MKISIICLLLFPALVSAQDNLQQVISSAGESYSTDNITISRTLGEIATETISDVDIILSQGFHQGSLEVHSLNTKIEESLKISVFPNPVSDILFIKNPPGIN